jgi:hypothetical protein
MSLDIELQAGPSYIRFALDWPYAEIPGYLPTAVKVQTQEFRGEFGTSTWVAEWQRLRDVLADLDQQVGQGTEAHCEFSDDARIVLGFEPDPLGHLAVHIAIQIQESDTRLEFWLHADQTHLALWARAIDDALALLPA